MAHISAFKKTEVTNLEGIIEAHTVIGLVDMTGISAKQLQSLRRGFAGKAVLRTTKNTLLRIALRNSKKKGMGDLAEKIERGASLIATDMNPFQLYRLLESGRTTALARPGQISPKDIVIPEGDTGLPPGPAVGELQKVGIPAKIERGSIVVQKETILVKKGERISSEIAGALSKLGIEPFEVGLNVLGVIEDGFVYEPSVLRIDARTTTEKITRAHFEALALCMEGGIFNSESLKPMIQKAYIKARSVAQTANIVTKETIGSILSRAYSQTLGLSRLLEKE